MKSEQWINFLGLIFRARKLITGEELVTKAVQKNNVYFVIISKDASENTKKKLTDKCKYYNVPYAVISDRQTIGQAIGKGERVVVAVEDQGFAKKIKSIIE
ncbi:YlxQ family RNA-binding protein [Bacillus shivajii]|uniref:YlxQ family RNA-binding protein n=1 Tax=Bacillus shivajii TaxID=1983719 RepID=UPI001CFA186F|nr:YlxQ family RNA-binding protein [Bacillus shivajii]UCZ51685.1 YlxQ family RNA-binding protein [Bacillus shivajii]